MYKFYEMQRIQSSISIAQRKKSGAVTAANVRDNSFVDSLVQHDDVFHILKGLRSAPAHWEAEKKKVIAMIGLFGSPTFFITLSAAESKWYELLVILSLLLDSKDITEEEAAALSSAEKARLIRSDPVTCSRYFDYRFRQLMKLLKSSEIFGVLRLVHYYWRIEFQH